MELDLSSLETVRTAAKEVNGWIDVPNIDVLVNNAGIMAVPYSLTVDEYESQLATNHLGPFLFTNLIMAKILASSTPRIVMVSSDGHDLCPMRFYDYHFRVGVFNFKIRTVYYVEEILTPFYIQNGETYDKWQAYRQSKTAKMLMALSLAQHLGPKHNVLTFSLHPGNINTDLGDHIDCNVDFSALRKSKKVYERNIQC